MMLYPAMRDLLKKIPSRYQMVNMVAHRAREISAEEMCIRDRGAGRGGAHHRTLHRPVPGGVRPALCVPGTGLSGGTGTGTGRGGLGGNGRCGPAGGLPSCGAGQPVDHPAGGAGVCGRQTGDALTGGRVRVDVYKRQVQAFSGNTEKIL